ncbi:MAG TPA: aminoacyl-tRNA hydrolase [Polyangiaceae bacterium]|nr:aminoacyl-tRNA hydrolase [Polyangiaceae bacterium]
MILLVGLGNPGSGYAATRHNVGFRVVDAFVARHGANGFRARFDGELTQLDVAGERVVILKPMTYMNRSGHSVRAALAFYKLAPATLLVVHDELDLEPGDVRLKFGGGEAGHNGLKSISEQLGTNEYARLRCGIGRAPGGASTTSDYVLSAFPLADQTVVEEMVGKAVEVIGHVIERGISSAMNVANRRPKP